MEIGLQSILAPMAMSAFWIWCSWRVPGRPGLQRAAALSLIALASLVWVWLRYPGGVLEMLGVALADYERAWR